MSDVLLSEIREIRQSQKRMEQAVLGDPEIGVPGLVKRTGAVEGKVKVIESDRIKLTGVVTGASFVISILGAYIFGR